MSDLRRMTVGQVVDFVLAYNERQSDSKKAAEKEEKKPKKRKASQADINAFFG